MIQKIGLLDKGLEGMVKTAWEIYRDWEKVDHQNRTHCSGFLRLFKQTFCRYDVSIEFMGLFDSINSCGILVDKLFPYTSNTSNVKHIRHAVSLHERRSKFKQNLFVTHSYLPHFLEPDCSFESLIDHEDNESTLSAIALPDEDSVTRSHRVSVKFSNGCSNDVLELWFSGDHADIGGNWPFDESGTKISVLSLRWILSFALEYGVLFKQNAISEFNEKFPPLQSCFAYQHDMLSFKGHQYPNYVSGYCSSEGDDNSGKTGALNFDSRFELITSTDSITKDNSPSFIESIKSPIFPNFYKYWKPVPLDAIEANTGHGDDSIWATFFWWILEIFPIGYLIENKEGRWRPLYWPNYGEKRNLPQNAKLHWSLLWRLKFTNDVDFSHLPKIYKNLQKIIEEEVPSSSPIFKATDTIVVRIDDIVEIKTGMIKIDFEKVFLKAHNLKKQISLDIDWSDPPNELASYLNHA